jgi:hypothetical protein
VRLSPKSIFFGLVALGLPVAVTIGWQLATPATRSAAVDAPGGAGGLGDAPVRHAPKPAIAPASSSSVAPLPSVVASVSPAVAVSTPVGPVVTTGLTSAPIGPPSAAPTEASQSPLPPLTMPPVPTPTEPDDPSPSASPSASPTPTDDHVEAERRFHRAGR